MEKRRLGRTGHMSSWWPSARRHRRWDQATADTAIQTCLDYGVNISTWRPATGDASFGSAHGCRRSGTMCSWAARRRSETSTAPGRECNRSLERLQTDRFDLYQLHSVGKLDILDECTRKGARWKR